jgi:hypothetical protein
MKKVTKLLIFAGAFLFASVVSAEGTGSVNSGDMPQFDGKSMAQVIQRLSNDSAVTRTLPPICDSLGITWNLTKTGPSITGTAQLACGGPWSVSGGNAGTTLSLTADDTSGSGCFCNTQFTMVGTVTPATRSFSGTHTQTVGCAGEAPVTAGLCN